MLVALLALGGTAGADVFDDYPPPPPLRVSVDGSKLTPLMGAWCWDARPGLPPACSHADLACEDPPQPPPCGPALVRRGAVVALYTRWGAESIRVTLRPPYPQRGRLRLRIYRAGNHRFLVPIPRTVRRKMMVDIDVRYIRGLTGNWSFDLKPRRR